MTLAHFTLATLPESAKAFIFDSHHLANPAQYRSASGPGLKLGKPASLETERHSVIWATDATFDAITHNFSAPIEASTVKHIRPRVDKTKEEQKRRVKEKAEVFTPSWVCNLQNNLIDEAVLGDHHFNTTSGPADKSWVPTSTPVPFTETYTWAHYVTETRLEMTCGEGPYLFSRYDTVSGDPLPVRDELGRWHRIGMLDRKLRVVTENVETEDDWVAASFYALRATFGYEWQGDNLLLARLNFINTFVDYYEAAWGKLPSEKLIGEVAEIASWNLWQMDGLKMVEPESCTKACSACAAKARGGHDGKVSVVRFGSSLKTFEELLPDDMIFGRGAKQASRPKVIGSSSQASKAKADASPKPATDLFGNAFSA